MPFKKGHKYSGSRAGRPNKTTQDVREAYKTFVEGNIANLQKWMKEVATKHPDKALEFMLKFSEYFVPKANKTEIVDKEGSVIWTIRNANESDV